MIIYGYGQNFFRFVLTYDIFVEFRLYFGRFKEGDFIRAAVFFALVLFENFPANFYTFVADINAVRSRD